MWERERESWRSALHYCTLLQPRNSLPVIKRERERGRERNVSSIDHTKARNVYAKWSSMKEWCTWYVYMIYNYWGTACRILLHATPAYCSLSTHTAGCFSLSLVTTAYHSLPQPTTAYPILLHPTSAYNNLPTHATAYHRVHVYLRVHAYKRKGNSGSIIFNCDAFACNMFWYDFSLCQIGVIARLYLHIWLNHWLCYHRSFVISSQLM